MLYNNKLAAKPDHSHYPVCLGRLTTINDSCHKLFRDTIVVNGGLLILTLFGQYIPVISLISTLFGEPTEVIVMFIQVLLITGISVMTALGCGKNKFFNAIALLIYVMIAIGGLIHKDSVGGAASFLICTAVVIMNLKMFVYWLEYRQLSNTEGFPLFSERLTEYDENRYNQNPRTTPSAPTTAPPTIPTAAPTIPTAAPAPAPAADNSSIPPVMPVMPTLGAVPVMAATNTHHSEEIWTKFFAPHTKKESRISESPIKTM
ncbi:MAG: hypothetical protein IJN14_00065 [Ruminococcus sp.]|nr:hypothetical protein [Ruminococcus sp.]